MGEGTDDLYTPTETIHIVFEGTVRPDYVSLFRERYPVDPWHRPSVNRFRCFRFGHVANQCRSQKKYKRCGSKKHEETESCRNQDTEPCCANCKGTTFLPIVSALHTSTRNTYDELPQMETSVSSKRDVSSPDSPSLRAGLSSLRWQTTNFSLYPATLQPLPGRRLPRAHPPTANSPLLRPIFSNAPHMSLHNHHRLHPSHQSRILKPGSNRLTRDRELTPALGHPTVKDTRTASPQFRHRLSTRTLNMPDS